MKKLLIIKTALIICSCYVITQFVIIPTILNGESSKSVSEVIQNRKKLVSHFLGLYQSLHIPLVVLELDILQKTYSTSDIKQQLSEQDFLTFGLFQDNRALFELHQQQFEDLGFAFNKFVQSVEDGRQTWNTTTHYFLTAEAFVVHIVVFLDVSQSIWHTGLVLPHARVIRIQRPFLSHPGIFDRFDTVDKGGLLVPSPLTQLLHELPNSYFIPCNLTRANHFLANYPTDSSEDAQRFQRKARQVLARAKQLLDDLDISFWLSSGTCLGWFRQCGVITYSQDVDIGIFIKQFKPELIPMFERGGFFLKNVFGKVADSYELSFQAGEIKLDIFFFYEEQSYVWNGGTHHETGQKYKYIFPKFSLCWTVFLELKVRVPCPSEPYIIANYGENWLKPIRHWEWNKSPPNVRENGIWPKEEWPEVIQVY